MFTDVLMPSLSYAKGVMKETKVLIMADPLDNQLSCVSEMSIQPDITVGVLEAVIHMMAQVAFNTIQTTASIQAHDVVCSLGFSAEREGGWVKEEEEEGGLSGVYQHSVSSIILYFFTFFLMTQHRQEREKEKKKNTLLVSF